MTKTERLGHGFREDEKRVFTGTNHPNSSGVNGTYFSKTDHSSARKGADVSRQKYTIMLAFPSKLIKGKEAKAKPRNMCIFSIWSTEFKAPIPVINLK